MRVERHHRRIMLGIAACFSLQHVDELDPAPLMWPAGVASSTDAQFVQGD